MTEPCCDEDLLSGPHASPAARDLGVRGFVALWRGERRTITDLSADRDTAEAMLAAGRLEVDGDGVVVGAHGLVARATAHRIEHADGSVNTWCALDAIGIPAALALDASAVTTCPCCGVELRVGLQAGDPDASADMRLWLPGGSCIHLVDDFCRHANLYCGAEHLASVVPTSQAGRAIEVAEAASIGRSTWRDVAAAMQAIDEET